MNRQNIINRLLYLRNWEFMNIFLVPICLYITLASLEVQNWQPYAFSVFIICVILIQGTFYWHLKLRAISKNEITLPPYFSQTFSTFKRANVVLLSIYPVLIISSQTNSFINFQVSIWSNVIFLFAILEHINYYHYQLSHDSLNDINYLIRNKKIRRSPLYIDLQKDKERVHKQTTG
jgi:hypothetical protein